MPRRPTRRTISAGIELLEKRALTVGGGIGISHAISITRYNVEVRPLDQSSVAGRGFLVDHFRADGPDLVLLDLSLSGLEPGQGYSVALKRTPEDTPPRLGSVSPSSISMADPNASDPNTQPSSLSSSLRGAPSGGSPIVSRSPTPTAHRPITRHWRTRTEHLGPIEGNGREVLELFGSNASAPVARLVLHPSGRRGKP